MISVKEMQVDHIWPQHLAHWQKQLGSNRIENLNPSCRKCNNFKGGLRLDYNKYSGSFRQELERQVERLRKNSQFDRALRFGLVQIIDKPVRFFFEDFEERAGGQSGYMCSKKESAYWGWIYRKDGTEFMKAISN